MSIVPSVAPQAPTSAETPPSSFLDLLKQDLENPTFNDVQLESSDGELVPCSRFILCKRSVVFSDLLEFPDETAFPTPFPSWLLREIRHVCYFGTISFKDLKSKEEETLRKLCQLLVAMDYYQLDNTLSAPIFNDILNKIIDCPSLACIVLDEFGFSSQGEMRPWIAQSVKKAVRLLKNTPYGVLLPEADNVGGVCSIQDANTIQRVLSVLKSRWNVNVWLEFEVLYTWAKAKDTNRRAAADLWEETEMAARLMDNDSEYFDERNATEYNVDCISSSQEFVDLYKYAQEKNKSANASREPPFVCTEGVRLFFLGMFTFVLLACGLSTAFGWIDPASWEIVRVLFFAISGYLFAGVIVVELCQKCNADSSL